LSLPFEKYHGTANDFIIIDNRQGSLIPYEREYFKLLCDRHMGIGADGLLILETAPQPAQFRMRYFNADGGEAAFCGNGSRCLFAYATKHQICRSKSTFIASDGHHHGRLINDQIEVDLQPVALIDQLNPEEGVTAWIYDSGVEHLLIESEDCATFPLVEFASRYAYPGQLREQGINISVFSANETGAEVRTFERGVFRETMSCGTGNVAVAYHILRQREMTRGSVLTRTAGGILETFWDGDLSSRPWLRGNATFVFAGTLAEKSVPRALMAEYLIKEANR
jgi:diaminopimelate epimerase